MYLTSNSTFKITWSEIISDLVDLSYSIDNGDNWISIESVENHNGTEFGQGYYDWQTPSDLNVSSILISVKDHGDSNYGFEQEVYVVTEEKHIDSVWRLEWSDIYSDTVKIEHQINNTGDWITITNSATNHNGSEFGKGYYDWLINIEECDYLVIRISDTEDLSKFALSYPVAIVQTEITPISISGNISLNGILVTSNIESNVPTISITGDINLNGISVSSNISNEEETIPTITISGNISLNGITVSSSIINEEELDIIMINEKLDALIASLDNVTTVTDQLTFTNNLLNVRVADKGILNDITVNDILSGTVDTKTVNQILEILLAYINGKITVSGNNYIYYKQDGTTSLFTITAAESERTVS